MIRLIACDIDGTLLLPGQTSIAPVVFEEIRRLDKKGVRFCPNSGRRPESLRRLFAPVAERLYYICENFGLPPRRRSAGQNAHCA